MVATWERAVRVASHRMAWPGRVRQCPTASEWSCSEVEVAAAWWALCLTCRSVSMTEVMPCADPAVVGWVQYLLPHGDWG